MSAVLDASMLVKLVLEEPGSEQVRNAVERAIRSGISLCTADLAIAEALNAIWKHAVLLKDIGIEEAKSAASDLVALCRRLEIVATLDAWEECLELALKEGVTVYDALYVAAAKARSAELYTADSRLYEVARAHVSVVLVAPPIPKRNLGQL